jgi:hypothetical protein
LQEERDEQGSHVFRALEALIGWLGEQETPFPSTFGCDFVGRVLTKQIRSEIAKVWALVSLLCLTAAAPRKSWHPSGGHSAIHALAVICFRSAK